MSTFIARNSHFNDTAILQYISHDRFVFKNGEFIWSGVIKNSFTSQGKLYAELYNELPRSYKDKDFHLFVLRIH